MTQEKTPETIKFEVSEWLLKHGEESLTPLKERLNPNYKFLPDFAYELYIQGYEDEVLRLLRENVMNSMNLNVEQIDLFYNKRWVIMLLGNEIFKPKNV